MEKSYCVDPKFVSGATQELFTIEFLPTGDIRGIILFVPPFAEEMNRSRKMVSRQARLFAKRGFHVIVPDLSGTGDSHGEFSDASWDVWRRDLAAIVGALQSRPNAPLSIWALRLGALLALDAVRQHELPVDRLVLWSPCTSGSAFMTQFLRLRLLSSLVGKSDAKESLPELKAVLESGDSIEVAGYEISAELYRAVSGIELKELMAGMKLPLAWLEMVADERMGMPAAASRSIDMLNASGCQIESDVVTGPKFWSTAETTVSDALAERSLQIFDKP